MMMMLIYLMMIACTLLYGLTIVESKAAGFVASHNIHGSSKSQTRAAALHAIMDPNNKISSREDEVQLSNKIIMEHKSRRLFLNSAASFGLASIGFPFTSAAQDGDGVITLPPGEQIQVLPSSSDLKKLFNEGRALEAQGNILAAQRLYSKITKAFPNFIYGWSSLGNTLTAQGELNSAEEAYTRAVSLCEENLRIAEQSPGTRRCDDLYLLLLNRGSVRLNNNQSKDALVDLQRSNTLRARPDAVILQNLARAQELNSQYASSDRSYTTAISMTANEVNPFWIRSSMVKYQLNDLSGAMDLMRRVENRFPEAPEVRAAYAVMLLGKGDEDSARKKFLEIPDRQRLKFTDEQYLNNVIAWPPVMQTGIAYLAKAVGDR